METLLPLLCLHGPSEDKQRDINLHRGSRQPVLECPVLTRLRSMTLSIHTTSGLIYLQTDRPTSKQTPTHTHTGGVCFPGFSLLWIFACIQFPAVGSDGPSVALQNTTLSFPLLGRTPISAASGSSSASLRRGFHFLVNSFASYPLVLAVPSSSSSRHEGKGGSRVHGRGRSRREQC